MCVYVTDHTSCSLTAFHHIPFQCVSSKLFCFFSYNRPHNYSQQDDHHFSVEDFNIVCICRWLLSQDMWLEMCLCVCFCHLLNLFLHCNVKHHSFNIRRFYCVQMFFFLFFFISDAGGTEKLGETLRGSHDQRCQDRGRSDGRELQGTHA